MILRFAMLLLLGLSVFFVRAEDVIPFDTMLTSEQKTYYLYQSAVFESLKSIDENIFPEPTSIFYANVYRAFTNICTSDPLLTSGQNHDAQVLSSAHSMRTTNWLLRIGNRFSVEIANAINKEVVFDALFMSLAAALSNGTRFISPGKSAQCLSGFSTKQKEKQYSSLGIQKSNAILVVSVDTNSIAHQLGIHGGDTISKIDGKDVHGYDLYDIFSENTNGQIVFTVICECDDKHVVKDMVFPVVPAFEQKMLTDTIGWVIINRFTPMTEQHVAGACRSFSVAGVSNAVIDLRTCTGGTISAIIACADYLIGRTKNIELFHILNRGANNYIYTSGKSSLTHFRYSALVGNKTELGGVLFAGILRNAGGVTLIGEKTKVDRTIFQTISVDRKRHRSLVFPAGKWCLPNEDQRDTDQYLYPFIIQTNEDKIISSLLQVFSK